MKNGSIWRLGEPAYESGLCWGICELKKDQSTLSLLEPTSPRSTTSPVYTKHVEGGKGGHQFKCTPDWYNFSPLVTKCNIHRVAVS